MTRNRSRRRSRSNGAPFSLQPWMIGTAVGVVLLALLASFPGVRRAVAHGRYALAKQAREDFGTPDPSVRVLVLRLLDHSGSSRNAKKDILNQIQSLAHIPPVTAETYIWRYAAREELIYNGVNKDRFVKPALRDFYENVAPPTTKGTNLGVALNAAERAVSVWKRAHPDGIVVLTIGTDGGVEDPQRARIAAGRLAGQKNVFCLVHGVLVEQRLREQITDALRPLKAAGRLYTCNRADFSQVVARFAKDVEQAIPASATTAVATAPAPTRRAKAAKK